VYVGYNYGDAGGIKITGDKVEYIDQDTVMSAWGHKNTEPFGLGDNGTQTMDKSEKFGCEISRRLQKFDEASKK